MRFEDLSKTTQMLITSILTLSVVSIIVLTLVFSNVIYFSDKYSVYMPSHFATLDKHENISNKTVIDTDIVGVHVGPTIPTVGDADVSLTAFSETRNTIIDPNASGSINQHFGSDYTNDRKIRVFTSFEQYPNLSNTPPKLVVKDSTTNTTQTSVFPAFEKNMKLPFRPKFQVCIITDEYNTVRNSSSTERSVFIYTFHRMVENSSAIVRGGNILYYYKTNIMLNAFVYNSTTGIKHKFRKIVKTSIINQYYLTDWNENLIPPRYFYVCEFPYIQVHKREAGVSLYFLEHGLKQGPTDAKYPSDTGSSVLEYNDYSLTPEQTGLVYDTAKFTEIYILPNNEIGSVDKEKFSMDVPGNLYYDSNSLQQYGNININHYTEKEVMMLTLPKSCYVISNQNENYGAIIHEINPPDVTKFIGMTYATNVGYAPSYVYLFVYKYNDGNEEKTRWGSANPVVSEIGLGNHLKSCAGVLGNGVIIERDRENNTLNFIQFYDVSSGYFSGELPNKTRNTSLTVPEDFSDANHFFHGTDKYDFLIYRSVIQNDQYVSNNQYGAIYYGTL